MKKYLAIALVFLASLIAVYIYANTKGYNKGYQTAVQEISSKTQAEIEEKQNAINELYRKNKELNKKIESYESKDWLAQPIPQEIQKCIKQENCFVTEE